MGSLKLTFMKPLYPTIFHSSTHLNINTILYALVSVSFTQYVKYLTCVQRFYICLLIKESPIECLCTVLTYLYKVLPSAVYRSQVKTKAR